MQTQAPNGNLASTTKEIRTMTKSRKIPQPEGPERMEAVVSSQHHEYPSLVQAKAHCYCL